MQPASAEAESPRAAFAAWGGFVLALGARAYLTVVATLLVLATAPTVFGLSSVVINGDSMTPVIGVGDVVVAVPYDPADPVPMGYVVGFAAPAGSARSGMMMHRVVGTNPDGSLVTAGDGNADVDSAPLDRTAIQTVGLLLVRGVGLPAYWASAGDYLKVVGWLALTAVAVAVELAGLRCVPGRRAIIAPGERAGGVTAAGVTAGATVLALLAAGPAVPAEASASFMARTSSPGNSWTYPAPNPAARLEFVTQPGNSTGGIALARQPVVRLLDAAGNPTSATRNITLSLVGGSGTLACAENPLATRSGVAGFKDCAVDKTGTYQLVASAASLPQVRSNPFQITVGPAARLVFTSVPDTTLQTMAFATQPALRIVDTGGNLTASTAQVTLSLTGSPSGVKLTCTQNPRAASAGVVSFAGCAIDTGGSYTLTAKASGLPDAKSPAFLITSPPPLVCTNYNEWYATFSWTPTPREPTTYTLYVNGIKVRATGADGWNSYVQLSPDNVPVSQFPAGKATVDVRQVISGGVEKPIGTGTVILGTAGQRTYLCG